MHTIKQCVIVITLLAVGARGALAQQAFEDKYVAATFTGELVPLPTIGIVPVATAPIDADVGTQLAEAMQQQMVASGDRRFEVLSRANGSRINWAFVVRNAPRAAHDTFTPQLTEQLITCLHSLDDGLELASLDILLVAGAVENSQERAEANAAGAQMLVNWKADRCATQRNSVPFIDNNRAHLTAATHGMLTNEFDQGVFHGQGLIDLTTALSPLYFDAGGFWTAVQVPRLHAMFEAAVRAGLPTVAEAGTLDRELRTFWDFAILAVSSKPGLVRSFVRSAALGCITAAPALTSAFKLGRCVADGKLALATLRVAGQDHVAAVRP